MTWLTSSGWASDAAAPSTLSTITQKSTFLCSSRYGRSWLNLARGPSSAFAPRRGLRVSVLIVSFVGEWLVSAVLLVHGLFADVEGHGDELPGCVGVACPANGERLQLVEFSTQLPDCGQGLDRIVRPGLAGEGADGRGVHAVNFS